jgi:hypothetical protein
MPKLLVFAPCEKVVISQDENNPTLIAILTAISIHGDAEQLDKALNAAPIEGTPLTPIRWSVFTMWQKEAGDESGEFTQTIDLESPVTHKVIITNRSTFTFKPEAKTHRITLHFPGFPVSERGEYLIRLSLNGNRIAEYPIELKVQHVTQPTS